MPAAAMTATSISNRGASNEALRPSQFEGRTRSTRTCNKRRTRCAGKVIQVLRGHVLGVQLADVRVDMLRTGMERVLQG